jgi:uncharacterized protein involved in high-affinity Fe2+ transport
MKEPTPPPMKASNEATGEQLDLARQEGDAYAAALKTMVEEEGGTLREVDDYLLAVVVEKAEGMYALDDERLVWHEPDGANAHVEVAVADRADGRFVPGLDVTVELETADGRSCGHHEMPFLWHPFLHHYGHNWKVPGPGAYTVTVHVRPASFFRHDPINGQRFVRPVEARFESVRIDPGVKPSPAASPREGPAGPTSS